VIPAAVFAQTNYYAAERVLNMRLSVPCLATSFSRRAVTPSGGFVVWQDNARRQRMGRERARWTARCPARSARSG